MATYHTQAMRRLREERKAQGLVQFVVWIPDTSAARKAISAAAARLVTKHLSKGDAPAKPHQPSLFEDP